MLPFLCKGLKMGCGVNERVRKAVSYTIDVRAQVMCRNSTGLPCKGTLPGVLEDANVHSVAALYCHETGSEAGEIKPIANAKK